MKRNFKLLLALILAFATLVTLASCKAGGNYAAGEDAYYDGTASGADKIPTEGTEELIPEDRKIIKTVYESVHTDKYDSFLSSLRSTINEAGGYISSASYNSASYYNSDALREARFVIRIPAEKLTSFTTTVESLGIVYSYNESMSDVTAAYVDVESRIAVLAAEETALLEMLSLATTVSDSMTIRTRLNEVQSDLASLEAQKRTYDSLISYSTVNMTVYEVRRAEAVNPSFFEEVSGTFSDSLADIGDGLRSFAIWFLGNIIYIVLFAALVTGGTFLIIRYRRKRAVKVGEKSERKIDEHENDGK